MTQTPQLCQPTRGRKKTENETNYSSVIKHYILEGKNNSAGGPGAHSFMGLKEGEIWTGSTARTTVTKRTRTCQSYGRAQVKMIVDFYTLF